MTIWTSVSRTQMTIASEKPSRDLRWIRCPIRFRYRFASLLVSVEYLC